MSKIAIKGNESGTATFTIEAPATNTDRTFELPDEAGKVLTNATPGTVLQVVSTTKTNTQTIFGGVFVDISGLSVSITPTSATSKFLILAHVSVSQNGGVNGADFRFVSVTTAATTAIGIGDADGSKTISSFSGRRGFNSGLQETWSGNYLDSPGTSLAITYKVQTRGKLEGSGGPNPEVNINRSRSEGNNTEFSRTTSTITVMEIAG